MLFYLMSKLKVLSQQFRIDMPKRLKTSFSHLFFEVSAGLCAYFFKIRNDCDLMPDLFDIDYFH
ncbi:MAG: hypothetical protein COV65_06570 [Nitrosopumilales archaeon CG11_big_fil_rev_8_21_14_0_20_33_24]|nr:MAG: hypothetical protein COV65_06570 [Nitrosopumilales archaeon CG11_big_fil_rev_8_21_14_0_20_33_24]PIY88057.1 MAG: hypothetical protein COY74_10270 [Nitrosopumilales archaeon CG_4_10_14_0_8_um_filter_34_8]PJB98085.1 MAG: hypothetical protein CO079_03860 [Nitrosopumilales archaeon CG_4_9_14_0_8_um_filter_34_10]